MTPFPSYLFLALYLAVNFATYPQLSSSPNATTSLTPFFFSPLLSPCHFEPTKKGVLLAALSCTKIG